VEIAAVLRVIKRNLFHERAVLSRPRVRFIRLLYR